MPLCWGPTPRSARCKLVARHHDGEGNSRNSLSAAQNRLVTASMQATTVYCGMKHKVKSVNADETQFMRSNFMRERDVI